MTNRIKELRKRKKLSQSELAELAGVSRQTISSAERGGAIRVDTLRAVAAALGVQMSEIFFIECA